MAIRPTAIDEEEANERGIVTIAVAGGSSGLVPRVIAWCR
jgi:hypothetical protein